MTASEAREELENAVIDAYEARVPAEEIIKDVAYLVKELADA